MTGQNGKVIVLIDDDHGERELCGVLERELDGVQVLYYDYAERGKKFWEDVAGGLEFDVALVDLSLPGEDGYITMERIREVRPDVRIISYSRENFQPVDADFRLDKNEPIITKVGMVKLALYA